MIQRQDGWVFLSHSTKDYESVRQIRNELENHGFRPIMFFLKCLTDGDELDSLIYREIAARRWFIYIDSTNSRASDKVKQELDYARTMGKKIHTIYSEQDFQPQLWEVMRRATVFLSYSHKDQSIADQIRRKLIENDFQTWWDENIHAGSSITTQNHNAISDAGFVLLLLTEQSVQSDYVLQEMKYAQKQKHFIIPVLIGNIQLPFEWYALLGLRQFPHISASPTDAELDELIERIIQFHEEEIQ